MGEAAWFMAGLMAGIFVTAIATTWMRAQVGGVIVFPVSALKRFISTASIEENVAVTKLLRSCGALTGHSKESREESDG
jgi:hypothetical protein